MAMQGIGPSATSVASRAVVRRDPSRDLARWQPSTGDPWDARKAAHLLRRAGFGGRPEEIEAAVALGVDRTIDILLSFGDQPLPEHGSRVLPHGEVLDLTYDLASQRALWVHEMAHGFAPLREKLALFWHNHFSVGAAGEAQTPLLLPHINVLRRHALGSFRELVVDVTRDPAMLYWLDNHLNGKTVNGQKQVNENYGRELLELYTMGLDSGYTQSDVVETAKVLSGWTLDGWNRFVFDPQMHIDGDKVVLGYRVRSNGMQELFDLLDNAILPHAAPATFLARKLWRWFVAETAEPGIIDELARRLRQDGYRLRGVVETILRSNWFFSSRALHAQIKNPVEYVIGALRATNTPVFSYKQLGARISYVGYPLLRYSSPFGLPGGAAWINAANVIARGNFANEMTQLATSAGIANRFDPFREIVQRGLTTAEAIVDRYLDILVDGQVPAAVRARLYDFMHRTDAGPEPFTMTPAKVIEKVRGLVHQILMLPEASTN